MGTKVKGLLRGLRYISQIFDEKEEELEIGFPTDVKHVAHIGWDGPSASTPSWMNEFKGNLDPHLEGNVSGPRIKEEKGEKGKPREKPGPNTEFRRRHASPMASPKGSPKGSPKQSRRRRSASKLSVESQEQDSSGSGKLLRQQQANGLNMASFVHDSDSTPKHSRRRKPKGSSKSKDRHVQHENVSEESTQEPDFVTE